jgi:hypothetical protein
MTAAAPQTAIALLVGAGNDAPAALLPELESSLASGDLGHVMARLPTAARQAGSREISAAVAGLLDVNLADVLVTGWRKYEALTSAARSTLKSPGTVELVELASHQVTAQQDPYVAIAIDGRRVATLYLSLSVEFDVSVVLAGVSRGLLTTLHSGSCDVTAALAVQGSTLLTQKVHLDLPGVLALKHGIRLLPAEEYASDDRQSGATATPAPDLDPSRVTDAEPAA